MGNREYLRKLWAVLIGSVIGSVILTTAIYKLGLMDKLLESMQENIILTMLVLVPIVLNSMTNVIFGFGVVGFSDLLEGVYYNRLLGILPIYNSKVIRDSYYSSELYGIVGTLPVITEISMVLFYVVGLVYLFLVDGFFIFSPRIIIWGAILFGLYFINSYVKSIVLGMTAASFDDIVPFRSTSKYYIIPLILGAIVIIYYLMIPISVKFKIGEGFIMKSTLANTLTIFMPFVLPIYSMMNSRKVISFVKAYYSKNF